MKKSTIIWITVLVITNGLWFIYGTLLSQQIIAERERAEVAREHIIQSENMMKFTVELEFHRKKAEELAAQLEECQGGVN